MKTANHLSARRGWAWVLVAVGAALVTGYGTLVWGMRTVHAKVPTSIIINVVQHKLYLYRNHKLFHAYPVAVGKPGTPSPRGEFVVTQKAIWGDGFGTRWIRFSAPWGIYGIHGTNKPWSVGTVASHGCFRMYNHDVEQVYALVSIGTPVTVEGVTPLVKIRRPLNPGQIGQDVVELQRLLRLARIYSGALSGVYTPEVKKSVETFQTVVHLPVTGIATEQTTKRLLEYTQQTERKPGYLSVNA